MYKRQVLFRFFLHVVRNIDNGNIVAQIIIIDIGFHFQQIDNALEVLLSADGQLNRNSITFQAVFHHVDNIVEVGAHDEMCIRDRCRIQPLF